MSYQLLSVVSEISLKTGITPRMAWCRHTKSPQKGTVESCLVSVTLRMYLWYRMVHDMAATLSTEEELHVGNKYVAVQTTQMPGVIILISGHRRVAGSRLVGCLFFFFG